MRTGWTLSLLLRMSSVPTRKYLCYTYFRNVSHVTLPRWSSTDRHQRAGDVTSLNVGIPRKSTVQNPVSRKRKCYMNDATNWGFQGNYVKCRSAIIRKYYVHKHTHTHTYTHKHTHIIRVSVLTTGITTKVLQIYTHKYIYIYIYIHQFDFVWTVHHLLICI